MEYKGYLGSVEFSEESGVLYGKVLGVRALISYEGASVEALRSDFHGAVDQYLSMCQETGRTPERAYKGSFNVRVSPELHRQAALYASDHQMSLNSFVESALRQSLALKKL
jgi:predicted HicB family RNase H-like nuclease